MKYDDDAKQQTDTAGPKKKLTREDFKKDVASAVKQGLDSAKAKSTKRRKLGLCCICVLYFYALSTK